MTAPGPAGLGECARWALRIKSRSSSMGILILLVITMGIDASGTGPFPLGATGYLQALGIHDPTPQEQAFMQRFQANKIGNPDDLYTQYLKSVQLPQGTQPYTPTDSGTIMRGIRRAVPFVDTAQGHTDLQQSLNNYPFTDEARQLLKNTLIRSSMDPAVVQEEAETNPESYLGFRTGRSKMKIAEGGFVSPPISVTTHELMHSYLDTKGYPNGEDAFNQHWETAKQTTPLLHTIDRWLATSPDYTDEQNRTDLSQERFAYLAQALSGSGLKAFPKELQPDYAAIFR
jgi:hypothetical protein